MKLTIRPNENAAAMIRGKAATLPPVLGRMLPDIRQRAFVVSRVTDFDVLKRLQDKLATLPEGGDWSEIRRTLAAEISPYMDDSPEGRAAADARAELLLRVHGFQAYAAARYQTQRETADALPFWQYRTVGDSHVRDEHAALDGKVFRADDPFWVDHYPPWDYGCRCVVVAITEGEAERMRAADTGRPPEARRVLEGEALEAARAGTVELRGKSGQVTQVDVSPPLSRAMSEKDRVAAYRFRPGDLHPDLDQLRERYDAPTFQAFAEAMRAGRVKVGETPERSAWDWLYDDLRLKDRSILTGLKTERVLVRNWGTGERVADVAGGEGSVNVARQLARAREAGQTVTIAHNHPSGDWRQSGADLMTALANRDVVRESTAVGGRGFSVATPETGKQLSQAQLAALRTLVRKDPDAARETLAATGVLRYTEVVG